MTAWTMIQTQADPHTLSVLSRADVELKTDPKPTEYFFCTTTGRGPFKRVGRLVTDNERTRIFIHGNVTTAELAYLTSALASLEQRRWNDPRTVDCGWYPNGEPYKRAFVCRPIEDEDLSMEMFEMVDLTMSNSEDLVSL